MQQLWSGRGLLHGEHERVSAAKLGFWTRAWPLGDGRSRHRCYPDGAFSRASGSLRDGLSLMSFSLWLLFSGLLMVSVALTGNTLGRLPVTAAIVYLLAGYVLGPAAVNILRPDPLLYAVLLERVTEIAMLISLFAVGLKLGLPLRDRRWRLPARLALISMTVTITLIAILAATLFDFSPGVAVLLGAILAPTDPVLASDVQVASAEDRDRLRFSLTAEGALNDGIAFPIVMLGLGLLGLHDLGANGWHWLARDVVWGAAGGLAIGGLLGTAVGKLVLTLRTRHKESIGRDEFLALGLIALSYATATLCRAGGFLAVFAAGLALQRVSISMSPFRAVQLPPVELQGSATRAALAVDAQHTSAFMMQEVQTFNSQLERIAELVIVLLVGAMFAYAQLPAGGGWFIALLFFVIRPLSVVIGLLGSPIGQDQRVLLSWFGIRGIGSVYYLMHVINQGLPRLLAEQLMALTLYVVAVSIVAHGISVTPLMNLYVRRKARRAQKSSRARKLSVPQDTGRS